MPVDTSESARRENYFLGFSVQQPGANFATLAIANLRSNALILINYLTCRKNFMKYSS